MMATHRPKLLVLDGPYVPGAELARVLGDRYDVAVAAGGVGVGQASLATGGFQVVFGGTGQFTGGEGQLSDREAAAMLSAIGEGLCLSTADGRIVWANDCFRSFDEQTRARISAVCRRAAQRFNDAARVGLQSGTVGASGGSAAGGGCDGVGGTGGGGTPCEAAPVPSATCGPTPSIRQDVASSDESRFFEVVVSPVPGVFDVPAVAGSATSQAQPAASASVSPPPATPPVNSVQRVIAMVSDVTPARRRQHKIAAIDRAGAELVRLDAELIRKLHVGERLKVLEEKILKSSHDLLHFDHLAIRIIDEPTGKMELIIASGLTPQAMEVQLFARKEDNGIMGYVAATGESYLCGDVTKDPKYVVGIRNARSSLTVPLRLGEKIIGAFNVESEKVGAFTDEDRVFAEMFTTHIALALHILDLLVVERCETGASITGTVQDELSEPLSDIAREADWLKNTASTDSKFNEHIDRIMSDVQAIRSRVKEAAQGPQHILGAEKGLVDLAVDPALVGKRVLIADDEPKIRQTIRDALRGRGCSVVVCDGGAKAIEELEKAAAARSSPYSAGTIGHFDLLISDIKMPDKNGYEVFSAARRLCPGIPAILMTGFGYDPHHSIVRATQEGLQCVLFKPFQLERLLEEVKKALGVATGGSGT